MARGGLAHTELAHSRLAHGGMTQGRLAHDGLAHGRLVRDNGAIDGGKGSRETIGAVSSFWRNLLLTDRHAPELRKHPVRHALSHLCFTTIFRSQWDFVNRANGPHVSLLKNIFRLRIGSGVRRAPLAKGLILFRSYMPLL